MASLPPVFDVDMPGFKAILAAFERMVVGEMILAAAPVLLEVNVLLTVHGTLSIDYAGTLEFEPSFDARMFGFKAMSRRLGQLKGVRRTDGGRRVVIEADEPLVLRGAAAQQAYVVLAAMLEVKGGEPPAAFVHATAHRRFSKREGVLAVGRSHLHFGIEEETLLAGSFSTVSMMFEKIGLLDVKYPGIHIRSGEHDLSLECSDPLWLRDLLVDRWFHAANPIGLGGSYCCLAARRDGRSLTLGHLVVWTQGLCFVPADSDKEQVLIPRRRAGVMEVQAPLVAFGRSGLESLHIGTDEDHFTDLLVADPAATVTALEAILSDMAWFPPGRDPQDLPMEQAVGMCAYTSVWFGHELLATRQNIVVAPSSGKLRLNLDEVVAPTAIPCPVRVEIASSRGRSIVVGKLTDWLTPDAKTSRNRRSTERTVIVALSEFKDANRRLYYRLPLKDTLPLVQIITPPPGRRAPTPAPINVDDVRLFELSRNGAVVWLPLRPNPNVEICFQLVVETREQPRPAQIDPERREEMEEPEITVESFQLQGRIVHMAPQNEGKVSGWRLGLAFQASTGHDAFVARQRAVLRQRAAQADER